ncbi:MAG: hypothetical protein KBD62_37890 [Kofleriaceae bacterium]|nr:hypothetical protein [Kofleriaceae bacterium]
MFAPVVKTDSEADPTRIRIGSGAETGPRDVEETGPLEGPEQGFGVPHPPTHRGEVGGVHVAEEPVGVVDRGVGPQAQERDDPGGASLALEAQRLAVGEEPDVDAEVGLDLGTAHVVPSGGLSSARRIRCLCSSAAAEPPSLAQCRVSAAMPLT